MSLVAFTSSRGVLGDVSAQLFEQRDQLQEGEPFFHDVNRTLTYATFCIGTGAVLDRYLYTIKFPQWFPSKDPVTGMRHNLNIAKAVLVDNFLSTPFLFFPAYYLYKDCFMGLGVTKPLTPVESLEHYRSEFFEQNIASLLFWVPANTVTFGVIPTHLRVAFVSVCTTGYLAILSVITASLDKNEGLELLQGALKNDKAPEPDKSPTDVRVQLLRRLTRKHTQERKAQ